MGWPFSTPFVVLRAFAKVIAASRATNTVRDFTVGDFITVFIRVQVRINGMHCRLLSSLPPACR